jgi:ferrochelatase
VTEQTAVLLLAYGGPDSLDDIPAYLLDVRGGRETPHHLIDEITERYAQIGGRSPLLDITRSVAAQLSEHIDYPVYVGMRHWRPYIEDVVAEMAADGVRRIVAICMAPHYSMMSIGAYRRALNQALDSLDVKMDVAFVERWGTQPDYLRGIAANVRKALRRFPEEVRDQVKVVFTAHSLPASILERGDPYDAELRITARLLAERLRLERGRWTFCYQSAAQTGTPWLGPQIEEVITQLGEEGERYVLVAPIGFIADHVEVLYDIDIGVQRIAREAGIRLERPPMLNDSPPLIDALAAIARERLALMTETAGTAGQG